MAKPFDNWGASLLDSVKIFDLIAERRATFGTERVLSMVCQEYVNAFGGENYKNRNRYANSDYGAVANISVFYKNTPPGAMRNLIDTSGDVLYLILVQKPNENIYSEIEYPYETSLINVDWELCHVTKGIHGSGGGSE